MTILVNPGSDIAPAPTAADWTNTYDGARAEAECWLKNIRDGVSPDVEISHADPTERGGRWRFTFRHTVTGVTAILETHGISDVEAYMRKRIFAPRVYWLGSSTANPQLSDFAAPGYVQTYRAEVADW